MRTRTRTLTPPASCGLTGLNETFVDLSTPLKGWKACSHSYAKVTSFQPGGGTWSSRNLNSSNPPTVRPISDAVRFPGAWVASNWRGWVSESLDPQSDLKLEAVDMNSVVLELSRSSTNLAETIATFSDTVNLFRAPGLFLKHAAKSGIPVSRRPLKELRKSLDTAGQTWLSGTYGYLPLISDLQNLASFCASPRKALNDLKKPLVKDIRNSVSDGYCTRRPPGMNKYHFSLHVETQRFLSRMIRLEGTPNPAFHAMSLANQLATYYGLNDFGRLAWELTPGSFVFDWFSSLGRSVASIGALNGPLAYCNVTVSSTNKLLTKQTYTVTPAETTTVKNTWLNTETSINVFGGSCVLESCSFSRSARGEADLSGSTFQNGLSSYRTATGMALLLGSLGRITGW